MQLQLVEFMDKDKLVEDAQKAFIAYLEDKNKPVFPKSKFGLFPPSIRHPDGNGEIYIGDDAYDLLLEISELIVQEYKLSRIIAEKDIVRLVLELFREVTFGFNTDIEHGDEFFEEVSRRVESSLSDYIVYIPFIASHSPDANQKMYFGDVVIHNSSSFDETISEMHEKTKKKGENFSCVSDVVNHYQKYHWVIEVPVKKVYSTEVAMGIAEQVATIVLNVFHIRISASHSDRMIVGFDSIPSGQTNQLYVKNGNELSCIYGYKSIGNVGLPDKLSSLFDDEFGSELLTAFTKSIDLFLDLKKDYPHNRRILEAAYWYGDAVRENNKTVRVVKYFSALERLVIFGEDNSLTSRICNRVAALLLNMGYVEPGSVKSLKEQIKNAYHLRSCILHGSISPYEKNLSTPLGEIDELCRNAIVSFSWVLNKQIAEEGGEKNLKEWLINLVTSLGVDKVS